MLLPLQNFPQVLPLDVEQDKDELLQLFTSYFKGSIEEISSAIDGRRVRGYNYAQRLMFGIRHPEDGSLVAACIMVQQRTNRHRVLEIVWFATLSEYKGSGYGTTLFHAILEFAKVSGVDAVLVTSTNRALSFWMSRTGCVLSSVVLRGKTRARIQDASLSPVEEENKRNHGALLNLLANNRYSFENLPKHSLLEGLYRDKVNRNRKGKISAGQTFSGAPYRYNIEESNHLWFLVSPQLQKHLGAKRG